MNYTYILLCKDNTLYTGWTNNLAKRLEAHQAGRGSKYTKSRLPVQLLYTECFEEKTQAMRREWEIKQLSRAEKLALIKKIKERGDENGKDL